MKRLMVLLAAASVLASCVHPVMPPPPANDCENNGVGNPNNRAPVGCISVYHQADSYGGLIVHPLALHASVQEPVVLKWRTRGQTEDISIEMKSDACTTVRSCKGKGTCTIPVKQNAAPGTVCRYEITVQLGSGRFLTLDPIVKIDDD